MLRPCGVLRSPHVGAGAVVRREPVGFIAPLGRAAPAVPLEFFSAFRPFLRTAACSLVLVSRFFCLRPSAPRRPQTLPPP